MSLPFLLEVGSEEIPDWMIPPALAQLRESFMGFLDDNRIAHELVSVDATPRRLVLRAEGLPERQPDTEELVTGPPKSAGPGAAQGFAKKQGADASALETISTPKGEYFAVRKKTAGRATRDVLGDALPDLILGLNWPKTMYWTGKNGPRFIRPIRWIVAMLGDQIVPFKIAGVRSGSNTRGHRQLGGDDLAASCADYEKLLRTHYVIVSADERRQRIQTGVDKLLDGRGLRVRSDPGLLETLTFITEFPTPILGRIDPEFLALPEEVLVTVMRHHQKYFSVEDAGGKLAPFFIAVMNTASDPEGLVVHGNERVLKARFTDARFFWDVDQKKTLADRVDDLKQVTFLAKLSEPTYYDKTRRIVKLAGELGGSALAERAALLSKCDLTTEMVKEFTELQGVVGGLYARAQGEPEEVARAIAEHYNPVSMEDSVPTSEHGRIVALADKLDTLRECFAVGLAPKGSSDPLALRRAAQGVVKILVEAGLEIRLDELAPVDAPLHDFLLDRVRYYFREVRGFRYDEVNAVVAAGVGTLPDMLRRLSDLQAVRPTEHFEPLAASFKRIRNILTQAKFDGGTVDAALLEAGPERELYEAAAKVSVNNVDYRNALESIASLRPHVDRFFDKVMVNVEDASVRRNRLSLLHTLLTRFNSIADFSEIVTEKV